MRTLSPEKPLLGLPISDFEHPTFSFGRGQDTYNGLLLMNLLKEHKEGDYYFYEDEYISAKSPFEPLEDTYISIQFKYERVHRNEKCDFYINKSSLEMDKQNALSLIIVKKNSLKKFFGFLVDFYYIEKQVLESERGFINPVICLSIIQKINKEKVISFFEEISKEENIGLSEFLVESKTSGSLTPLDIYLGIFLD